MTTIIWRNAETETDPLLALVQAGFAGAPAANSNLWRYADELWPKKHGLAVVLGSEFDAWHRRMALVAGSSLFDEVRLLTGRWYVGAYSLRRERSLYVFCGAGNDLSRMLKHELLHYYLRRVLPKEAIGSPLEERIVQFETGWNEGADAWLSWRSKLLEVSNELNNRYFDRRRFEQAVAKHL